MKRNLLSLAVFYAFVPFALVGCAVEPKTIFQTVEVQVPVPVPCKAPEVAKPKFALDAASVKQGVYSKGAAALAELKQRQAYEARLEAAVAACR